MKNTYCQKCIFSQEATSHSPCEYDIPNNIKNIKNLSIKDNFYIIEDYTCLYGFGKDQYSIHKNNINHTQLKEIIKEKTELKSYLLLDARLITIDQLSQIINELSHLEIKPKKVSFIVSPENSDSFYRTIHKNLSCEKWTMHVFINDIPFNDCINIVLDTNLQTCNAWCVIFYDASRYIENGDIDKTINSIHKKLIIQQLSFHGVFESKDSLHKLCLNCHIYKLITSTLSNDILKGLSLEDNIILSSYETK